MRKTALFLVICLIILAFCGCTTASDAKLYTTQGDAALEAREYKSAIDFYKKAIDTGTATNKVKALCEILSAYIEASEAYENDNFTKADYIINDLEYDYNGYSPISEDMRELIRNIDISTQSTKRIDRALSELAEAIGESDYDTAYELINEIDGYSLDDDQKEEYNYQIGRMHRKQGNSDTAPEEKPENQPEAMEEETKPQSPEQNPAEKPLEKPTEKAPATYEGTDGWYRIRKSWDDPKSQIHALKTLENAKKAVNENPGYKAFDDNGNCVYP